MSEYETDKDIAEAMDWSAGKQPDISETLQQMVGPAVTYTHTFVPTVDPDHECVVDGCVHYPLPDTEQDEGS